MFEKSKNQDTEGQILDAAINMFQTKGMNDARMQEIADNTEINKAMLHHYYRSTYFLFFLVEVLSH